MAKGFDSKPAEMDPYKTKNSTAKYSEDNGDEGAGRVGNSEPNPYGKAGPRPE